MKPMLPAGRAVGLTQNDIVKQLLTPFRILDMLPRVGATHFVLTHINIEREKQAVRRPESV
jgi:hypothetical protein